MTGEGTKVMSSRMAILEKSRGQTARQTRSRGSLAIAVER
jgi:hypothetical protein